MPIVDLEFSFLLHKHKLNIYLLIYRSLCRYSCKYSAPGEKKMLCTTQQRPLCSVEVLSKTAAFAVYEGENGGLITEQPWDGEGHVETECALSTKCSC